MYGLKDQANLNSAFTNLVNFNGMVGIVYVFEKKNGEERYSSHHGGVCHANLRYAGDCVRKNETLRLVLTKGPRTFMEAGYKKYPEYLDWLVNMSPWAEVHLEKDSSLIVDKGFVLNPDVPNNYFASAVITSRHFWEFPNRLSSWRKMFVDYDVDPTVAFLLSYKLRDDGKTGFKETNWGNHPAFNYYGNLGYFSNIYNKIFERPNTNFSKYLSYRDVDDLWTPKIRNTSEFLSTIKEVFINIQPSEKTNFDLFKEINPWAKLIHDIKKIKNNENLLVPYGYIKPLGDEIQKLFEAGKK